MGYFNNLLVPAIVQEAEENEKGKLNFENEDSAEQRSLARQDLIAAKALSDVSKSMDAENKSTKKALNRKAKQTAMEAVEHAQKSVIYADEEHKVINNDDLHTKLEKTHNNSFLQREQKKTGMHIVEKSDIEKLNSAVKKKRGEKSPYNAVRYTEQEIDDKTVNDAIAVAEKAVNNLDKKVEESKKETIKIGNQNFYIDFNHI